MSWIIGIAGNNIHRLKDKVFSFANEFLFEFENDKLFIRGGGNDRTFFSGKNNDGGFAACGVGIEYFENSAKFLSSHDYDTLNNEDSLNLNGHFVFTKWNNKRISILTDKFGLRDIFVFKNPGGGYLFSTCSDWLAKIVDSEINYKVFGSRWLLFNQISSESIFDGIKRINCGSEFTIELDDLSSRITKHNWFENISEKEFTVNDFKHTFEGFTKFPSDENLILNLSLSGGMDSRAILSQLLKSNVPFSTHTFGNFESPDSKIAKQLSETFGIKHEQIDLPLPSIDETIYEIKEYVSQSLVNNSVSSYIQLRNYDYFKNRSDILIDGGFGEIWRREFFNRLLITGKKYLREENVEAILPFLMINRADIFNNDIKLSMIAGCEEQLEAIFKELPSIKNIGVANWVDLFAIKTRLVNYYSHEQIRSDGIIQSYMPFLQPALLDNILGMKLTDRKNGKMLRQIINTNNRKLGKFPLAKGELTHPFWFSTIQTRLYLFANKKLKGRAQNYLPSKKIIDFLYSFVQDTINSQPVKNADCYDQKKLSVLSAKLFKRELSTGDYSELDWWLAFEIFRQDLENKS